MATITRIVTGYPARAVRTSEFLYIRNLRPDRWPAGDPELVYAAGTFGDCDESPTKQLIVARRDDPQWARYFELCFAKRPAEELYDLRKDPAQTHNVAGQPEYAAARLRLRGRLEGWMKETGDPGPRVPPYSRAAGSVSHACGDLRSPGHAAEPARPHSRALASQSRGPVG